jgi:hypothetical protein
MQNGKYIEYSAENTVEVIVEQRLDEGVEKNDPKAAKYKKAGPDGQEVEYMVEWPNLTYDEMMALARSPAGQYNNTGKIPYTSIVNPHTLKEFKGFSGGTSGKSIIEACDELKKILTGEHGKGLSRADIRTVDEAVADAKTLAKAGDFAKSLDGLGKVEKKFEQAPEAITAKLKAARDEAVAAARTKLDEVKALDTVPAKREISKLMPKLKGTGFEEEAREFQKSLNPPTDK